MNEHSTPRRVVGEDRHNIERVRQGRALESRLDVGLVQEGDRQERLSDQARYQAQELEAPLL